MEDLNHKALQAHLQLRARIIQAIRQFFIDNDYLEVETPVRIPAPAPEAYIDAVASEDWFLQTSPELSMKRLLAAGFARIFQICKCFRQAERGRWHLPEITLLEWYRTQSNYQDLMNECESLIIRVAGRIGVEGLLVYQGNHIDLTPPWTRISVKDAFETYSAASLETALQQDRFDDIMVSQIEPQLGRNHPVFLYDYPACRGAFAKLKPGDPRFAERFELYIGGVELCNAFSELTDSVEQRTRFKRELDQRAACGKARYPLPEKFLADLMNMPEAAGNALGIDRLCMLFADVKQIDEVVAFTPEAL